MKKYIIFIIVFIICVCAVFIVRNVSVETEYTPETEIQESDFRKTVVALYFKDKSSGELVKETQLTDSKLLLNNPYNEILNMLIKGPQNDKYESIIPENTKVLECNFENGCVSVKLEVGNETSNSESIVESIKKTLKELNEVYDVNVEMVE